MESLLVTFTGTSTIYKTLHTDARGPLRVSVVISLEHAGLSQPYRVSYHLRLSLLKNRLC